MNNVVDEVLTDNPKFRISDSNGNVLYDNISIELTTPAQVVGTALNKLLFDSIKADLDSRLLIADKSTQAEAEAGSNNTKYMTPLRVKNYHDENIGVKYTNVSLSSSESTTIDLSNVASKVKKIEVVFNADLASQNIVMSGTGITIGNISSTSTSVTIGRGNTLAKLEIYPDAHYYKIKGYSSGMSEGLVDITGRFTTITSISVPQTSSTKSYQVSLYEYLN